MMEIMKSKANVCFIDTMCENELMLSNSAETVFVLEALRHGGDFPEFLSGSGEGVGVGVHAGSGDDVAFQE